MYKIPYRQNGDGEEFYIHKTKNHGRQFYRLRFGADAARFEGTDKEHIATALKDEEIKHDTVITRDQLDLLEKYGIKLASIWMSSMSMFSINIDKIPFVCQIASCDMAYYYSHRLWTY